MKEFRDDRYVIMATRHGVIKKTELSAYSNPRAGGIIGISSMKETADRRANHAGKREILLGTRRAS